MARKWNVLAISGSTRNGSTNERILKRLEKDYDEKMTFHFYQEIATLPHFNPDLDKDPLPVSVTHLREVITNVDGILICTPEYIFALPGALKNLIEWTVSTTLFQNKPLAFIVASGLGEKTFESLSLIMDTLSARIGPHSRLLIQGARGKLRADENFDEHIQASLVVLMQSFMDTLESAS